jgi:hypothetical protein
MAAAAASAQSAPLIPHTAISNPSGEALRQPFRKFTSSPAERNLKRRPACDAAPKASRGPGWSIGRRPRSSIRYVIDSRYRSAASLRPPGSFAKVGDNKVNIAEETPCWV